MITVTIQNRWSGAAQFVVEVEAGPDTPRGELLGLAARQASGEALERADLAGVALRHAMLTFARLNDSDLRGADLMGANLSHASFARADLTGADLRSAELVQTAFDEAVLVDACLDAAELASADFTAANLSGASLFAATLPHARFTGACLAGADLRDAVLTHADFTGADLSGARLAGANLFGARFDGTTWAQGLVVDSAPLLVDGMGATIIALPGHLQIDDRLHTHAQWAAMDASVLAALDISITPRQIAAVIALAQASFPPAPPSRP